MEGGLRSLLASFHIAVDEKELKEAHENMEGFRQLLKTTGNALAETFAVREVGEFIRSQIEAGTQLKVTAERIGLTTQAYQAMQLAAGEASVSTDALAMGLTYLNRNIQLALQQGGEQARVFQQLGIHLRDDVTGHTKDAGTVIGELADKLQGIEDPTVRANAAMTLLGRGGMELIPLLNKGSAAFAGARAELEALGGGLSDDFVKRAEEAEIANVRLGVAMRALKSEIAMVLFPEVKAIAEEFTKVVAAADRLEKHTGSLSTAAEFFGVVAGVKALGTLREIAKTMGILKPSVLETVGALMTFAGPIVGLVILYAIFDDLVHLLRGQDSLIGRMLGPDKKRFVDDLRKSVQELREAFGIFRTAVFAVGAELWNLDKAMAPLGTITSVGKLAGAMRELGEQIAGATHNLAQLIDAGMKLQHLDFKGALADLKDTSVGHEITGGPSNPVRAAIRHFFGGVGVPLATAAYVRPSFVGPLPSQGGPAAVNVVQNVNTKVDVHTNDAHGTGKAVGRALSTATQRANERARNAMRKP